MCEPVLKGLNNEKCHIVGSRNGTISVLIFSEISEFQMIGFLFDQKRSRITDKKNCIVITSKVCKDFPRESANTFAPSKVCIDFHSESPGRLSGRKYLQTLVESLCRLWR